MSWDMLCEMRLSLDDDLGFCLARWSKKDESPRIFYVHGDDFACTICRPNGRRATAFSADVMARNDPVMDPSEAHALWEAEHSKSLHDDWGGRLRTSYLLPLPNISLLPAYLARVQLVRVHGPGDTRRVAVRLDAKDAGDVRRRVATDVESAKTECDNPDPPAPSPELSNKPDEPETAEVSQTKIEPKKADESAPAPEPKNAKKQPSPESAVTPTPVVKKPSTKRPISPSAVSNTTTPLTKKVATTEGSPSIAGSSSSTIVPLAAVGIAPAAHSSEFKSNIELIRTQLGLGDDLRVIDVIRRGNEMFGFVPSGGLTQQAAAVAAML